MISFAGAFKNLDEDWVGWLNNFEHFLARLAVRSAKVRLDSELDGEFLSVNYVPCTPVATDRMPSVGKSEWKRWIENLIEEDTSEEKLVF